MNSQKALLDQRILRFHHGAMLSLRARTDAFHFRFRFKGTRGVQTVSKALPASTGSNAPFPMRRKSYKWACEDDMVNVRAS